MYDEAYWLKRFSQKINRFSLVKFCINASLILHLLRSNSFFIIQHLLFIKLFYLIRFKIYLKWEWKFKISKSCPILYNLLFICLHYLFICFFCPFFCPALFFHIFSILGLFIVLLSESQKPMLPFFTLGFSRLISCCILLRVDVDGRILKKKKWSAVTWTILEINKILKIGLSISSSPKKMQQFSKHISNSLNPYP